MRLCHLSWCRSLSLLGSGSCGSFQALIEQAGFLTQEVFDIVAAAHARCSNLLIKEPVRHRCYANGGCRPSVLSEEEGLCATLGACLLSRGRKAKGVQTGTLADEHFDVVTI